MLAAQSQEQLRSDSGERAADPRRLRRTPTTPDGQAARSSRSRRTRNRCNVGRLERPAAASPKPNARAGTPTSASPRRSPGRAAETQTPRGRAGEHHHPADRLRARGRRLQRRRTPTAGVSGITATTKYDGRRRRGRRRCKEQTTGSEGCVVFGGLAVHSKPSSKSHENRRLRDALGRCSSSRPKKSRSRRTSRPTTRSTYNRGGRITAEFAYNRRELRHRNNEVTGDTFDGKVNGDTFVRLHSQVGSTHLDYEVGGEEIQPGHDRIYNHRPTTVGGKATSPATSSRSSSEKISWSTYAGDCMKNNAESHGSGVVKAQEKVFIAPGETTAVKVPHELVDAERLQRHADQSRRARSRQAGKRSKRQSVAGHDHERQVPGRHPNNESRRTSNTNSTPQTGAATRRPSRKPLPAVRHRNAAVRRRSKPPNGPTRVNYTRHRRSAGSTARSTSANSRRRKRNAQQNRKKSNGEKETKDNARNRRSQRTCESGKKKKKKAPRSPTRNERKRNRPERNAQNPRKSRSNRRKNSPRSRRKRRN